MATNSNNTNPDNNPKDNSTEPNKKRYVPSSPTSAQKPNTPPYPQSLLNKQSNNSRGTLSPSELKAKFNNKSTDEEPTLQQTVPVETQPQESVSKPVAEPKISEPQPSFDTKNFRYQQKEPMYTLPIQKAQEPRPQPNDTQQPQTVKIEETRVIPQLSQEPQNQPKPVLPEPALQAIPITLSNNQEEVIIPVKVNVEPELPKAIPKLDVNPLPPSIEEAVKVAVDEDKQTQTLEQQVTQKEEVANLYVKEDKFNLPGTDSNEGFKTQSEKIRDEITSKFAPKAEVKAEPELEPQPIEPVKIVESITENKPESLEPLQESLKPIVAVEAVSAVPKFEAPKIEPIVKLDVNPLPEELEQAVNVSVKEESQILTNEDNITVKPEVQNKYVKSNKYSLPGTENEDGAFKTQSEKIREDITSKFRPKQVTEEKNIVNQQPSDIVNNDDSNVIVAATAATATEALTPVIISADNSLDGMKPLIKFNNNIEDGNDSKQSLQDSNQSESEPNQDTNVSAVEYLQNLEDTKPKPKYTPTTRAKTDTNGDDNVGIVEAAAIGTAAAIESTGNNIDIGNKVTISNNNNDNVQSNSQASTSSSPATPSNKGANIGSNLGSNINRTQTSGIASEAADPNRYISAPSIAGNITSSKGGTTETTTTSTTTTTTSTKIGAKITFDVTRQSIRSGGSKAGKGQKKSRLNGAKSGLIAIAAAISLNAAAGIVAAQDSGIFDGVNNDGSAIGTEQVTKPSNNFITDDSNVGPKYQPTAISEFGQRQGTYDAEGKFTESPISTNPNDPKANTSNNSKPKSQQQSQDGIPALDNSKASKSAAEQSGFADQGAYDADGNLKQNIISSDALDIVNTKPKVQLDDEGQAIPQLSNEQREQNAINNAPGAIPIASPEGSIPGQQSPQGGPSAPAPINDASQVAPSEDQSSGAELTKGKKESIQDKIMGVFAGVYTKQALVLLSLIVLTLMMILGIALGAGYYFLAGVCSNGALLNGLKTVNGIKTIEGADALFKTCEVFTALTGIGCGSTPDTTANSTECIAGYLDVSGDTLTLNGLRGEVKSSKATIKQIMKEGHLAFPNDNTIIQYMVAIYPVVANEKGFQTDIGGCLGAFRLCQNDYELATADLGVKDKGDFLNSPNKQIKAFEKIYNIKKASTEKTLKCVSDFFNKDKKSFNYKLMYNLIATSGCPDVENADKVKPWSYADAAEINFKKTDCPGFRLKITTAFDSTFYFKVANSISSIGSYIGNGLNKFNINLKVEAAINPTEQELNGSKGGLASKTAQDKVVSLIKTGKLLISEQFNPTPAFIADITGAKDYPNKYGNKPNGPLHENTAGFLIYLATSDIYKMAITALGNNTHGMTPAWHNSNPIRAVDFAGYQGRMDIDSTIRSNPTEVINFLTFAQKSNVILEYLTYRPNLKVLQGKVPGLKISPENGTNHFHFSISDKGTTGIGTSSATADCPIVNVGKDSTKPDSSGVYGKPGPKGTSTPESRLNKKSIPLDADWYKLKDDYERTDTETLSKRTIDSQTNFGVLDINQIFNRTQTNLYNSDDATRKIYEQAKIAGFEYRKSANQDELNVSGPRAMKKEAAVQLKKLFDAMAIDGLKPENLETFSTTKETKISFEKSLNDKCKAKFNGQPCLTNDLANGKYADILQETFKSNNVPNMSLNETGLVINIKDRDLTDISKFTSSLMYKYITEDNQINLKKFGFILVYQFNATNLGPLELPNQIFYAGTNVLKAPDLDGTP